MDKFVSVAEMVSIEKAANANGITYDQMMANAGSALAQTVQNIYGHLENKTILGLVGKGNNGGDTLVALQRLIVDGWIVNVYIVGPRQNDPLLKDYLNAGGKVVPLEEDKEFIKLKELIIKSQIILDGLLGTGIRLPLRDPIPRVLEETRNAIRKSANRPFVVAVDCPSGIDCDSGDAASNVLPADLTVCMAAVKQGLLKFPAYKFVGELKVVGIGLPDDLDQWKEVTRFVVDKRYVDKNLPNRPLDAHKGTFGTVLVIAGSLNYPGAALLAGKSAFRSGAGWVTMAVPSLLQTGLLGSFPEATWLPLPHENGVISESAAEIIHDHISKITSVLIGPGFGLEKTTKDFLENLLRKNTLPPLVIDADGLKLLAQLDNWFNRIPNQSVLTPHPGEMSVLSGMGIEEIQSNRVEAAESFSKKWGHVVVLKGAFTVVAEPDGKTGIVPVASPALARAGTGDVLAGLITGLRAQGMNAFSAALTGTWLHAQAGLAAAKRLGGTAGVLAGDLIEEIPTLL